MVKVLKQLTIKLAVSAFVIAVLTTCDTNLADSNNVAIELEGEWLCEEYSSGYKSTNDFYYVTIEIYSDNSNEIIISNFYQLGNNIDVIAKVNGLNIELPSQITSDGSTIYGFGVVSDDYKYIIWNYSVDIGDNLIDEVSATYTRIE